jgi:type II secretory pathway component PulF
MSYYQYLARDAKGETQRGVVEALSEIEVARKLKAGLLYPVEIKAVRSRRARRVADEHVIRFFNDLSDLLYAGLPVDRALALISTNQTNKVFQRVVEDMLSEVRGGADLSGALAKYREIFGHVADHMVRAGEAGGATAPILKRLAQYLEQRLLFKQSMVSSMIYPCILLFISGISLVVLLIYVIPKFAQIFHDLNQKVPFMTNILLKTGVFLKDYGWIIPIMLAIAFFGGRYLYSLPRSRKIIDRVLIRVPFSRYLIVHSELTRFCRALGTMLQAGVPMLRSISLGEQLLMSSVLKEAISPLHREIKAGRAMSNFFRSSGIFPVRMGSMLRIAEEQGNPGEGLIALGDHFDRELQRRLQRLMTLFEPLVIIATALVIGVMVLSMFTAIVGINDIKF